MFKKNKKGFTLIELISVIVVIAILSLILVPTITKIIVKTKKQAFVDEVYSVLDSFDYYYVDKKDEVSVVNIKDLPLEKNKLQGMVYYDGDMPTVVNITNGSYCILYANRDTINVDMIITGDCKIDKRDILELDVIIEDDKIKINEVEDSTSDEELEEQEEYSYYICTGTNCNEFCLENCKTGNEWLPVEIPGEMPLSTSKPNPGDNFVVNIVGKNLCEQDCDEEKELTEIYTKEIEMPGEFDLTCSTNNDVWSKEKEVTCNFPKGDMYINTYKIGDEQFQEALDDQVIKVYYNTNIIAKSVYMPYDDELLNQEKSVTTSITKIDNIKPIINKLEYDNTNYISTDRKVKIASSDDASGIKGYSIVKKYDEEIKNIVNVESNTFDIYLNNGNYILYVIDNAGNISEPEEILIKNVDKTSPVNASIKVLATTNDSITVFMQGEDNETGIYNYSFSIDGINFISSNENIYTFTNLESNKTYEITGRIYNNVALYSEAKVKAITQFSYVPKCEVNTTLWAQEKEITCTYVKVNNATYTYKIDDNNLVSGTSNFEDMDKVIVAKFATDKNIKVTAALITEDGKTYTSTLIVDKIDKTVPSIPILNYDESDTFSISKAPTVPSGIAYYEMYSSTSNTELKDGEWIKLDGTKNLTITSKGHKYTFVRAVSNSGVSGNNSIPMESTLPIRPYLLESSVENVTIKSSYSLKTKKTIKNYTCKIGINENYFFGEYDTNSLNCTFDNTTLDMPLGINKAYTFILCANSTDGKEYCSLPKAETTIEKIYLADVSYIGAYVSYDAGNWDETVKKPSDSTRSQMFKGDQLNENLVFGGYEKNQSKNSNAKNARISTEGWRILEYDKSDKSVSILHAGIPEYFNYSSSDYEKYLQKKYTYQGFVDEHINNTYINKDYALSGHLFSEDEFFYVIKNNFVSSPVYSFETCYDNSQYYKGEKIRNTIVCGYAPKTVKTTNTFTGNSKSSKNLENNVLNLGKNYIFSSSKITTTSSKIVEKAYYISTLNKISLQGLTHTFGLRPVVDLYNKIYAVGGSGTQGDPYILLASDEIINMESVKGKKLSDVAKEGDYVVYDAGYWDETVSMPPQTSEGYGKFGGYTKGLSRSKGLYCSTSTTSSKANFAENEYNWQVIGKNDNGAVVLTHAGVSECFRYNIKYGENLKANIDNRLNSLYLNDLYASSVHGFNTDDFKMVTNKAVTSCTETSNNCGKNTVLDKEISFVVLSDETKSQYKWTEAGKITHNSLSSLYGIKPVVELLKDVKIVSGSGTKYNPYVLSSSTAPKGVNITIDNENWSSSHKITIDNFDDEKYIYEYGIGTKTKEPTTGIEIHNQTFNVTENGENYIYLRVKNKLDIYSNWSDYVVSKIDNIPPTKPTVNIDNIDWSPTSHEITIIRDSKAASGINRYEYKIGTGSINTLTEDKITINSLGKTNVFVRSISNVGLESDWQEVVSKIDNSIPEISLNKISKSVTSITTKYDVIDLESGISSYECYYKKEDDSTYEKFTVTNVSSTISCVYNNLTLGTTYNTYIKVYNDALLSNTSSISTVTTSTTYEGDSLIEIVDSINATGRYTVKANGLIYYLDLYYYESDTSLPTTPCNYTGEMCVIKVNGNLNFSATSPSDDYAGLFIFVTGTFTNKSSFNMQVMQSSVTSFKNPYQDVYLWKNEDGTFEYVPGNTGLGYNPSNGPFEGPCYWYEGDIKTNDKFAQFRGRTGINGINRGTGQGGSGGARCMTQYSAASSYSKACHQYTSYGWPGIGTAYGGGGGSAGTIYSGTSGVLDYGDAYYSDGGQAKRSYNSTGAGSPKGSKVGSNSSVFLGKSGVGGLLIIYADIIDNQGTLAATGANGGGNISSADVGGGGSGGGSINLFYTTSKTTGSVNVSGGSGGSCKFSSCGGKGGNGTVTWMQINL